MGIDVKKYKKYILTYDNKTIKLYQHLIKNVTEPMVMINQLMMEIKSI